MAVGGDVEPGPLWQEKTFASLLPPQYRDLSGGPRVVVTGQQPGYLGGPLLTLYKIATAIVLARKQTSAGRPTVPVFWSGDDDDDVVEALAPVAWDPVAQRVCPAEITPGVRRQRRIVAEMEPEIWAAPLLTQLESCRGGDSLQRDLYDLLEAAVATGQQWGPGQVALLGRVFADTGLVILRGNDPELHRLGSPFYRSIAGRLDELADLARQRGTALVEAGFHAQINERSLSRLLFVSEQGRRLTTPQFTPGKAPLTRPGVVLRSLLQDWLLRPDAVVVGPGELAYLRQLDPLYRALQMRRCPLVPRWFGWVVPAGSAEDAAFEDTALAWVRSDPKTRRASPAEAWADRVVAPAEQALLEVLQGDLDLPGERAVQLAAGRARRFRKGVLAMLDEEWRRQARAELAAAPGWLLPDGQRQERSLGWLNGVQLWGEGFVSSVLAAAAAHLESGADGDWREWLITVPEGTVGK